jgi:hypothetical protein
MTGFPICWGNPSEDIAQDDAFLDAACLVLPLIARRDFNPCELVKKTSAAEVPDHLKNLNI